LTQQDINTAFPALGHVYRLSQATLSQKYTHQDIADGYSLEIGSSYSSSIIRIILLRRMRYAWTGRGMYTGFWWKA
jgi:hypothetical protein